MCGGRHGQAGTVVHLEIFFYALCCVCSNLSEMMPVYWKKGKRKRDSGYLLYEWFYFWCDLLYSLWLRVYIYYGGRVDRAIASGYCLRLSTSAVNKTRTGYN